MFLTQSVVQCWSDVRLESFCLLHLCTSAVMETEKIIFQQTANWMMKKTDCGPILLFLNGGKTQMVTRTHPTPGIGFRALTRLQSDFCPDVTRKAARGSSATAHCLPLFLSLSSPHTDTWRSMRKSTTSSCPCSAARWSAVLPDWLERCQNVTHGSC